MQSIKVHEMIVDYEKKEVRIGKEFDLDFSQVESIHPLRPWKLKKYLSDSERKKVKIGSVGAVGTYITMKPGCKTQFCTVIESIKYIQECSNL